MQLQALIHGIGGGGGWVCGIACLTNHLHYMPTGSCGDDR